MSESDYTTKFEHASSHDWFITKVFFNGALIASKPCCRSYKRSARWALKRARDHMRGVEILEKS